jgi:hypothetical protein
MGKTCTRCKADKPLEDFPLKSKKAPDGPRHSWCRPCIAENQRERKKAANPDLKPRNLRTKLVTEETQKCDACELVKNVALFPEQTCKNGLPQKTCQDCQNATKAKRREAIKQGKREVGQGMAYHHPIVDGKKQCRECEEWKVLETEFPTRKDSIDGYFHECKDCRRDNARDYRHETWNAILQERQANDEQYRQKSHHRVRLYNTVVRQRCMWRFDEEMDCSGEDVAEWLQFRFEADMSWDNYGVGADKVWTIDHVIPLDWFDLKDPEERKMAFNWINIQPCRDNFRKHVELRTNEILAAFVSAHSYLRSKDAVQRFSIVGKILNWLQDKADVNELTERIDSLSV